jgi:hypothetical protein
VVLYVLGIIGGAGKYREVVLWNASRKGRVTVAKSLTERRETTAERRGDQKVAGEKEGRWRGRVKCVFIDWVALGVVPWA